MLDLWDQWQDFDRLRGEVDRLFGRYAGTGQAGQTDMAVRPATRFREGEDAYRLSVDLPGVAPDAIEVEAQGRTLRVRADRGGRDDEVRMRYERLVALPEAADPGGIEARHSNGVLELMIPKSQEAMPRRVEILPGDIDATAGIETGEGAERTAIGAPA